MNSGTIKLNNTQRLISLILFAIALNINTISHEYALDDIVVLTENALVKKGIKGIPEILNHDYVYGYSTKENILTGARYRPFSLVLFALEYEFFGANPMVSHLFNILLFALLIALLFKLLHTHIFREQYGNLAFASCLLFTVHPIHTEVIANVKSRDELIAFILLILSLIALIRYVGTHKLSMLMKGSLFFLIALLTKESTVTFLGVVPLVLYFFSNQSIKSSLLLSLPLILVFSGYMLLRYFIVGFASSPVNDVTNSPYIYATVSEAFATKVYILFKYMWLLVVPHPLSTEYGYNQIPYINLYSLQFILSFILLLSLLAYAVYSFKKRSLFAFCILYFLVTISVGTNFIFDLGTTMAERMLFQPSLAFCLAVSVLFLKLSEKSKSFATSAFILVLILFSVKTIARNKDWKNNETLFITDANNSPNSARINLFASETYIIKANKESDEKLKQEFLNKAVYYGERSLKIHSKFAYTYLRLGFAYYHLHNYFKAADLWIKALELEPEDSDSKKWAGHLSIVLYKEGNALYEQGKVDDAIQYYAKATALNANNVEAWYNLGGNYFLNGDSASAINAWQHVKKLDPDHAFKPGQFIKY